MATSAKKVFVGMSGGVDSSVSAALLKRAGYDVTGVFIKVWQPEEEMSGLRCTWREDRIDAMRVAAQLGIRFVTLDLEKEYKRHVVDYMIAEYRAGRTPNPDVMCNKYVKFGGFFDWAMAQGADCVATGHYAQVQAGKKSPGKNKNAKNEGPVFDLVAGDDANKDQSYFLWTLTQQQLARTLFPVGDIEKPAVRKLAQRFGLSTAEKKDSQGLCFIGKIDVKDFLSHFITPKKGNVLDAAGRIVGVHDGAFFFTLGERRGFIINDKNKTPHDEPLYVVAKNVADNTITVSELQAPEKSKEATREYSHLAAFEKTQVLLSDVNWIRGFPPAATGEYSQKIGRANLSGRPRYRAPLVRMRVTAVDTDARTCRVAFEKPQLSLSPGQSLVIYDGTVCLGGGIIS